MSDSSYNENMAKPIRHSRPRSIPLDMLTQGSESLAFHAPSEAPSELPQCSVNEHQSVVDMVGAMLDGQGPQPGTMGLNGQAGEEEGQGRETGGRSEKSFATPRETAKPLSLLSKPPLSPNLDHNGDEMVTTDSSSPNPDVTPPSDMPVLGDLRGVHQKEGGKVVESYHTGGYILKTALFWVIRGRIWSPQV